MTDVGKKKSDKDKKEKKPDKEKVRVHIAAACWVSNEGGAVQP